MWFTCTFLLSITNNMNSSVVQLTEQKTVCIESLYLSSLKLQFIIPLLLTWLLRGNNSKQQWTTTHKMKVNTYNIRWNSSWIKKIGYGNIEISIARLIEKGATYSDCALKECDVESIQPWAAPHQRSGWRWVGSLQDGLESHMHSLGCMWGLHTGPRSSESQNTLVGNDKEQVKWSWRSCFQRQATKSPAVPEFGFTGQSERKDGFHH